MSLRWRVVGLLAVLFLLLTGTGLAVVDAQRDVESQNRLIAQQLQPASAEARDLLAALVDQETGQRGYLITGDEKFLAPYRMGRILAVQRLDQLSAFFDDDHQVSQAVQIVRSSVRRWHRVGAEPEVAARRNEGAAAAGDLVARGRGKAAFDEVRQDVAYLQTVIDARLGTAQGAAAESSSSLRDRIVVSAVLRLLLFCIVGLLLYRWVLRPIAALRASMRTVADGDLETPVEASGPPEVAGIGRDAESMRRRIVAELESARAAGEALAQHSPVVTALRASLSETSVLPGSGVDVVGVEQAAEGVLAGDWWDAVPRPDGSVALVLADVSGHGAEAGLVALRLKERLTVLLRTELDLLEAFTAASQDVADNEERFVSCLVAQVEPVSRAVSWINAGHPEAMVVRRDRGEVTVRGLRPSGPLISPVTSGWRVEHTVLEPDELLIAVTDGVLDARRDDQEFGVEGVVRALSEMRGWSPSEAANDCVEAVRRFADDMRRDDVTCVVLACQDEATGDL